MMSGIEIYNIFPEGLNITREWGKGKINDHLDISIPFLSMHP
jgi:hypothetical protein